MKIKLPSFKPWFVNLFTVAFVFFLPLGTVVGMEVIHFGGPMGFARWLYHHAGEFFISYLLIFGLLNIFFILPKRFYFALASISVVGLLILAFVSNIKQRFRGDPLLPADIVMAKESAAVSQYLEGSNLPALLAIILVFLAIMVLIIVKWPKEKYRPILHVLLAAFAGFVLFNAYEDKPISFKDKMTLVQTPWDQKRHYSENGFIGGFTTNIKWLKIEKPQTYAESTMKDLEEQYNKKSTGPREDVNVVFVMNEAFWDPTVLGNVEFSEDPIPYYRSLKETSTTGTMMTNVFGGGTANTEFEIITGLSTHFLNSGSIAYLQYVKKPVESLASVFKAEGYRSTAIHTFHSWFYRRTEAYRYLDFTNFISMEFFNKPQIRNNYITDVEMSKRILSEIKDSKEKDFIYAVTMQNHGPYPSNMYSDADKSVKVNGPLSPEAKGVLETYTETLTDVDDSLKVLIEGLKELDEPTIVIFYGDHLPSLGENNLVYSELGFFQTEDAYTNYKRQYEVPLLIWNNYNKPKEQEPIELGTSFLGAYVLDQLNVDKPMIMDYSMDMYDRGIGYFPTQGYRSYKSIPEEDYTNFELIQYDQLFGKQYTSNLKKPSKGGFNKNFYSGSGKIAVKSTYVNNGNLIIKGQNFVQKGILYLNDEKTPYVFKNANTIEVKNYSKQDEKRIHMEVLDGNNVVIAESNEYIE